jgi:RNA polymerase sigma-70 factor (ECF subfamily)
MSLDPDSRRWIQQLAPDHPGHGQAVARLRELLVRVARHELRRRRGGLGAISGPEFDDLAEQAADDAMLAILSKLGDFRGLSRFTTWAYKFVVFQVSDKVARHAWQRQPPSSDSLALTHAADTLSRRPGAKLEQREQLRILSEAIGDLTERQREVFVAIGLNDVPMDVLALKLGSNRNAIYKNLFDARRRLRARLAEAGHPVADDELSTTP